MLHFWYLGLVRTPVTYSVFHPKSQIHYFLPLYIPTLPCTHTNYTSYVSLPAYGVAVAIRGIRNVVKHEFTSFFAEAFFSHGRCFSASLARMLLYVRQGAAPVNDFVVGDIDAVGLVGRLALTE